MLRAAGGALILLGGLAARQSALEAGRRAQRTRRELAEALERLEQEVRLCLVPIPRLLARRGYGAEAGRFFRRASEGAASESFAERWARAAAALPLDEQERADLADLGARLGGEAESVCAALRLAAARLRERHAREEPQRRERERLTTAFCLGASALLFILLV